MTLIMDAADPKRAYELWVALIRDEGLYEATLAGRHPELSKRHDLTADDLRILDQFRAQPGLRWMVENLRFRAAVHVTGHLLLHMQRTLYLLTRGDENWIQELVFEYLAANRWDELGHEHLREAERFGEYVKKRVLKRRIPPPYIDEVLDFELALVRHLRGLGTLRREAWPALVIPVSVGDARPRRSPSSTLIELPVDITVWIKSADPRTGEPRAGAICVLAVARSIGDPYKFQSLSPAVRALYDRFDGVTTVGEIVRALGDEYDEDDIYSLTRRWLESGALTI